MAAFANMGNVPELPTFSGGGAGDFTYRANGGETARTHHEDAMDTSRLTQKQRLARRMAKLQAMVKLHEAQKKSADSPKQSARGPSTEQSIAQEQEDVTAFSPQEALAIAMAKAKLVRRRTKASTKSETETDKRAPSSRRRSTRASQESATSSGTQEPDPVLQSFERSLASNFATVGSVVPEDGMGEKNATQPSELCKVAPEIAMRDGERLQSGDVEGVRRSSSIEDGEATERMDRIIQMSKCISPVKDGERTERRSRIMQMSKCNSPTKEAGMSARMDRIIQLSKCNSPAQVHEKTTRIDKIIQMAMCNSPAKAVHEKGQSKELDDVSTSPTHDTSPKGMSWTRKKKKTAEPPSPCDSVKMGSIRRNDDLLHQDAGESPSSKVNRALEFAAAAAEEGERLDLSVEHSCSTPITAATEDVHGRLHKHVSDAPKCDVGSEAATAEGLDLSKTVEQRLHDDVGEPSGTTMASEAAADVEGGVQKIAANPSPPSLSNEETTRSVQDRLHSNVRELSRNNIASEAAADMEGGAEKIENTPSTICLPKDEFTRSIQEHLHSDVSELSRTSIASGAADMEGGAEKIENTPSTICLPKDEFTRSVQERLHSDVSESSRSNMASEAAADLDGGVEKVAATPSTSNLPTDDITRNVQDEMHEVVDEFAGGNVPLETVAIEGVLREKIVVELPESGFQDSTVIERCRDGVSPGSKSASEVGSPTSASSAILAHVGKMRDQEVACEDVVSMPRSSQPSSPSGQLTLGLARPRGWTSCYGFDGQESSSGSLSSRSSALPSSRSSGSRSSCSRSSTSSVRRSASMMNLGRNRLGASLVPRLDLNRQELKEEQRPAPGPGAHQVKRWLESQCLGSYAKQIIESGYDDMDILQDADANETLQLCQNLGMLVGHANQFKRAVKRLRTSIGGFQKALGNDATNDWYKDGSATRRSALSSTRVSTARVSFYCVDTEESDATHPETPTENCGVDVQELTSSLTSDGEKHSGTAGLFPCVVIDTPRTVCDENGTPQNVVEVQEWLEANRLQGYSSKLVERGYDHLPIFQGIEPEESSDLAISLGMPVGHSNQFSRALTHLKNATRHKCDGELTSRRRSQSLDCMKSLSISAASATTTASMSVASLSSPLGRLNAPTDAEPGGLATADESNSQDMSLMSPEVGQMECHEGLATARTEPEHPRKRRDSNASVFNVAFWDSDEEQQTTEAPGLAVQKWLDSHQIGIYGVALVESGYDDMTFLESLDVEEGREIAQRLAMPLGHANQFIRALRILHAEAEVAANAADEVTFDWSGNLSGMRSASSADPEPEAPAASSKSDNGPPLVQVQRPGEESCTDNCGELSEDVNECLEPLEPLIFTPGRERDSDGCSEAPRASPTPRVTLLSPLQEQDDDAEADEVCMEESETRDAKQASGKICGVFDMAFLDDDDSDRESSQPTEAVREWLERCRLDRYASRFIELGYDNFAIIKNIDEEEAEVIGKELDMPMGHTRQLVKALKELQEDASSRGDPTLGWYSEHEDEEVSLGSPAQSLASTAAELSPGVVSPAPRRRRLGACKNLLLVNNAGNASVDTNTAAEQLEEEQVVKDDSTIPLRDSEEEHVVKDDSTIPRRDSEEALQSISADTQVADATTVTGPVFDDISREVGCPSAEAC
eukprot:TRINITY_DN7135_c0_g1_i2.p1 TRINITY_DN7135_c0_g1~~TRINITY_DN7135_c0_g1_i2.p1  ORF type:complete len:1715 (+),score=318.54 TRINITY_DN7135_c0_g1_i2:200-5146(+)